MALKLLPPTLADVTETAKRTQPSASRDAGDPPLPLPRAAERRTFLDHIRCNPQILADALGWQERGRVLDRFAVGLGVIAELMAEGKTLVHPNTPDVMAADWGRLARHIEALWNAARYAFPKNVPLATFLALTTMEETGKLAVARVALILRTHGVPLDANVPPLAHRRGSFYRHQKKYAVAAASGALINARMRRLYGEETVQTLLRDVENGNLQKLRETALYADSDGNHLLLPADMVPRGQGALYVALAGELLAEVQLAPAEWQRLLRSVDRFRVRASLRRPATE